MTMAMVAVVNKYLLGVKITSKPVINIERHCSLIWGLTRRDEHQDEKMTLLSKIMIRMKQCLILLQLV